MNLEYYIIRGRGEGGQKFQLAKLEDETGNNYKGEYDMARHFSDIDEMKNYIANEVVKKPLDELSISPMNI
ncbi:hypothetical protein AB835_08860 [Candidatus Endobugula sertula]|uniref:Uncharacterized protein n=1 Tax=Candidatus Endobugula sertula TaxID=62101 RepID=A0A1D2QPJ0_9GAMM|nr:hypothetical protein AB835_08860 [Candidatus Endobugula sertula]